MHCYTQCPQPCSRPPRSHASAGDSWTLTGKPGSDFCSVTVPFSWVLVHKVLCLCLRRVYFPACVSSGSSMVGLMATFSKGAYAISTFAAPRATVPVAVHCLPLPPQEMLKHSSVCLGGVPGSWCTQGLFESS